MNPSSPAGSADTWSLSSVPRRNPRVSARVINGSALVVVLDRREVHRLNRVGARIWELCDGRSLAAICQHLATEYDATAAAIESDLRTFVRDLHRLGALSFEGSASGTEPEPEPGVRAGQ